MLPLFEHKSTKLMDKTKVFSALAVLAGMIFIGLMIPRAVNVNRSYERIVNVKGLCEREVKADRAIWPIQYKTVGNDLAYVYQEFAAKGDAVRDFLAKGGITSEEITVSSPILTDKLAQEYSSGDRTFRYVAKGVITVCSSDVDKVLSLMGDQSVLFKKGIAPESEWGNQPEFLFVGLNEIKPEMVEEATKNAREVAEKFAKDSGSKLGKIKTASQGTFSIEPRDSNTPYIKKVRVVNSVTYYLSN